jgi:glycerol-3-phosphate dehydrogenase
MTGTPASSAGRFDRAVGLRRLATEEFDVLVIGGGVTGAGAALDAASRGLRTALVEARDWAYGTSSRSSKLVHGGLRYLSQREFRLVAQNLAERQRLLHNAPHLVKPLPFLIPMLTKDGKAPHPAVVKAYRTALWMYDLVGGARIGHRHRRVDGEEARRLAPGLRPDLMALGFIYWDAWADDARLTLLLARTAVEKFGAAAANYSPVASPLTDPAGRARGARLADGTEVRARAVLNATGVWADDLRPGDQTTLRPAKGIHITVPGDLLPLETAVVLPVPGDRRSIFAIPWAGRTYLGTTDTDYEGDLAEPECTAEDVEYLLRAANAASVRTIEPADVVGRWAGLRPLVRGEKKERTADLSRRHTVHLDRRSGVVTITGGKLTTYRVMAAEAIEATAPLLGGKIPKSSTRRMRLLGQGRISRPSGVGDDTWAHLVARYGGEASEVLGLVSSDASLAQPLVPGLPYLRAEVVWAFRREMAIDAGDVLERRTRSALLDEAGAKKARPEVEQLLASERAS